MKKFLCCMVALAMLLTTLAATALAEEKDLVALSKEDANFNPTGYPIVKEPVKKTIMLRKPANISDPAEMETLNYIAKLMNIEIEWIVVGADGWEERVNLMFASGDLPDIIMKGSIKNLPRVVEDGQLVAIDGLMEEYSTGLKPLLEQYPGVEASVRSADGKLYTLPGVNTLKANLTSHRNLWINKTWMDNLGLETPTTTEELLNVLRAFRDQDADGDGNTGNEIPYTVEDSGAMHNARPDIIAGLFGLHSNFGADSLGNENIQLVDGKVSYLKTDETWKKVLEYMNVMYKEGLLDNEVFTQTSDMSIGKISSGNIGVFGLSSDDLFTTVSDNYVALAPVKSDSGLEPVIALGSNSMGANTFITAADESPWVSFRLLDYFFTYEGSMTVGCFNEDLIGKTCQKTADGRWDYAEEMLNDERGVAVAVGEACPLPGGGFGYWRHEDNSNYIYSNKVQENVPVWEPYYQKDAVYGAPQFASETSDRINEIISDLDVYVNECQAKFITGEMSFDKWDEYVKTTVKLGAEELVGFYQSYYDAL
ncbi:extracellular solute-binding protein [Beduinella massiliensis]|uniref:extracellular solute-binding protein n=1 Tax=Beduinella massiliensis TaxID=1852363 RepID=UPI0031F95494